MTWFFRIIRIMGIVTAWASKALEDGKITLLEAADLAAQIGEALGIPVEIELPK